MTATRCRPRSATSATSSSTKDLPPELKKRQRWASSRSTSTTASSRTTSCRRARRRRSPNSSARSKDADELYLATDEDREGEAIAWHLLEVLKPKVPVKRMVFHEITKDGHPARRRTRARSTRRSSTRQETRRILDRLVRLRGLAGAVAQGRARTRPPAACSRAATRLVVDRERERIAFASASYWDLVADFTPADAGVPLDGDARPAVDGKRIAPGGDFDDDGALKRRRGRPSTKPPRAHSPIALAPPPPPSTCSQVESKPYTRRPQPPFTTSTLQQEAAASSGSRRARR